MIGGVSALLAAAYGLSRLAERSAPLALQAPALLLAILLGGAIGLERESRGRPAGLRTHILVCLGATIIMIASTRMGELTQALSPASRIQVDPGRIAAGIVTGIGFLGAGAIIRIGDLVRGLTTAGCIWFVAAQPLGLRSMVQFVCRAHVVRVM